ncbi:hypothetical protein MNBD_ALPHA06-559 [hydrothermal vent metagenome]|uniref:YhdP central domain-containing protein n=1 Tax=hydrothermal vent metagenome TaxID=652676 RepID=A0A3B0RTT0_9ZZZZ
MNKSVKKPAQLAKPETTMPRRALRLTVLHTLEFIALLMAIFLVVFGVIAWQLSKGPVSLTAFVDDAEKALVQVFGGTTASIGSLQAGWSQSDKAVVIVANDVQVLDANGASILQVPRFEAGLDGLSLLQQKLAFSRLVAFGGEVSVLRRKDGAIGVGVGSLAQVLDNPAVWKQNRGVGAPAIRQAMSKLRVLVIRDGVLNLEDQISGVKWRASNAELSFQRKGGRVEFVADGIIESNGQQSPLHFTGTSDEDFSNLQASSNFKNYVPADLVPDFGPLAFLNRVQAPVTSDVSITTDAAGLLTSANIKVQAGAGVLKITDADLPLKSGVLRASFDAVTGRIVVEEAKIEAGKNSIRFIASIKGLDPARLAVGEQISFDVDFAPSTLDLVGILPGTIKLSDLMLVGNYLPKERKLSFNKLHIKANKLNLSGRAQIHWLETEKTGEWSPHITANARSKGTVSLQEVLDFWPINAAEGVRTWAVNNMRQANIFDLVLMLDIKEKRPKNGGLPNEMLALSFAFDQVNTTYFGTMPPIENGTGTALLQGNRFDIKMQSASLLSNQLTQGYVEIPYLFPKGAVATYGAKATGPLADILTLLDQEPFGYASMYRIAPSDVTGTGEIDFQMKRPMRTRVPFSKMSFSAKGSFSGVGGPGLIMDQDVSGVSMQFEADQNAMVVTGEGVIGEWPSKFTWSEDFKAVDKPRTKLSLDTELDAALFDGLGLPTRDFFSGEVGLHLEMIGNGLEVQQGLVRADLAQAFIDVPGPGWEKPIGEPGLLTFSVEETASDEYLLDDLELQAEGLDVQGQIRYSNDGGLQSLNLSRAKLDGAFDFVADVSRDEYGAFVVDANISQADVSLLMASWLNRETEKFSLPVHANLAFTRVIVGERLLLDTGNLKLDQGTKGLERLDVQAVSSSGNHSLLILRDDNAIRQLNANSSDGGAVLQALFGLTGVNGGQLELTGTLGVDEKQASELVLLMQDFSISNTPVMAKLLSLGSLRGLSDTLSGSGMAFNTLEVPMQTSDGFMMIRGARATGPAMGLTLDGDVNLTKRQLNIRGAIAPAYTLNSILRVLPIVGDILVPKKGEGVFGLTYSITGPYEKMQVSVNPLSAFAPGILRQMFGGSLPELKQPPEPAKPELELPDQ